MKFDAHQKVIFFPSLWLFFLAWSCPNSYGWSFTPGVIQEDFTDITHWDSKNSTGIWNIVDHTAEAAKVTGAKYNQIISFGDGSDGILESSTGYTFNTNTRPDGYNFISVNITGGSITVVGDYPLVIRSLSTLTLVPTLSVRGANGSSGVSGGSTSGPSGGQSVASKCSGGNGGNSFGTPQGDGGQGKKSDGTVENATDVPIALGSSSGTPGDSGNFPFDTADAQQNWETASAFRCGAGGEGGGGHTDNSGHFSTGGSGGAGGGTVHLISLGAMSVQSIDASGGDAGVGVTDGSGTCSGSGAGGNSGSIWLQSFKTVTSQSLLVDGGNPVTNCATVSGQGISGLTRTDSALTSDANSSPLDFSTGKAAASQSYTIQSLPYDLGTRNAGFLTSATIETNPNNGSIIITYSGSTDGVTFSDETSSISALSNRNFRYIRFNISLLTASASGSSPQVKSIAIPFSELDIQLNGACGSLSAPRQNKNGPWNGFLIFLAWIIFYMTVRRYFVRTRFTTEFTKFPA